MTADHGSDEPAPSLRQALTHLAMVTGASGGSHLDTLAEDPDTLRVLLRQMLVAAHHVAAVATPILDALDERIHDHDHRAQVEGATRLETYASTAQDVIDAARQAIG